MKRIEMIGSPLDHVATPGLLNPLFREHGDPLEVICVEVGTDRLAGYVRHARADSRIAGLVVTTPLKGDIVAHLDAVSAVVALTGAANCVRVDAGRWTGVNLDGNGFMAALARLTDVRRVRSALLVGCGGAGSAVAASLLGAGVGMLSLQDAERDRADALAGRLLQRYAAAEIQVTEVAVVAFDLVVNASTAGLAAGDASPITEEAIAAAGIVADIVTTEDTALKRLARALGKPLLTGKAMVAGQIEPMRRFFVSGQVESRVGTA